MQIYSRIVSAADESRRMPIFKQLLKIRGKTMIEIVAEKAVESKLDEIMAVLGHEFEVVREYVEKYSSLSKHVKIV